MNQEDMVDKVVSAFIKELVKGSKNTFKELNDEGKAFLNIGLSKYLSEKYNKYIKIKTILKGNTPVEFYSVYFHLNLLDRKSSRKTKSRGISTKTTNNLFKKNSCITIIGDAGSGKSTLVKHLFIQSLKEKKFIPILIELRYIELKDISFLEYITSSIINTEISLNSRIIERMLNNGRFIFFLDGFDEINSNNEAGITKGIDDFVTKYNKNKYILTTRPHSNGENINNFVNYNISPLSKENGDIHGFVDLQLSDETELAEKIKSSVNVGSNEYIHSFLTNPLLLSLYILTYQSNAEIPNKKYIFYRRVINSLFSEHDSKSKLGYVREKRSDLTQIEFEKILKAFCFIAYFEGMFSFDHDYVVHKLDAVKNNISDITFNTQNFIFDMKISVSLWLDDAGILSFAHRSLQEYFAALFIKDLVDSNKEQIYGKLLKHCENCKNLTEVENFLSLCEEMDSVYFYKHYYLPLTNEIYKCINVGDTKNKLRNYILFLCNGITSHRTMKNHNSHMPLINMSVYKSIYIHIDHTRELHKGLMDAINHIMKTQATEKKILKFEDNEGLLDKVVEGAIDNGGIKLTINFVQYLENQIKEKNEFIDRAVRTDVEFINMV